MTYLKKISMPKQWPLNRKKGKNKYIMKPRASLEKSLAVLVILRNMLKLAETRTEIKKIILSGEIEVNSKKINDEKYPVQLLDVVGIPKTGKFYRLNLTKNGKLTVKEISASESKKKICKIIGKKIIKGKKLQLNLDDGRNLLYNEGDVNDSVLLDLKQNKIEKILKLKEKANVMIIDGKRAGHHGIITKIENKGKKRMIHIKIESGEVKSPIQNIIVLE